MDGGGDKNEVIKTLKNIINTNSNINGSSKRKTSENFEKNKEDQNQNNNNEIYSSNINKESNINIKNNEVEKYKETMVIKDNQNNREDLEEEKNEKDPLFLYMNSNIKINDNDIINSPKLILEEINCNLFNGKKIEINAAGMVGGRNKKDGFSIFGQKYLNELNNSSEVSDENSKLKDDNLFIPDYKLNYSKFLSYPYIFTIYFKKEEKSFYIKAFSGKGSDNKVLFIKLNNKKKFIISQKELILTGNIIFQLTPIEDNCLEIINLSKKNHNNKSIIDGFNKKIITIGRNKKCFFCISKR